MAKTAGRKKGTAVQGKARRKMSSVRSVAEILVARQDQVLADWLTNIKALVGTRTLKLMTEEQLRVQATELLGALTTALGDEQYVEIDTPAFADSVAMLGDISASRAEQGFTASETATFVFSLKDALLKYVQEELGDDPQVLNSEITRMNALIDKLGLVTFETYVLAREKVVDEQSAAILEMSTPIIKLWDEVLLLPLIGVIDTARSQQIIENLLQAIVEDEARMVIFDISGVPIIDTEVARHMLKIVASARMLGAEMVLTGIRPDTAQTLVKLGVDLSMVRTKGTLRSGVVEVFRLLGLSVQRIEGGRDS